MDDRDVTAGDPLRPEGEPRIDPSGLPARDAPPRPWAEPAAAPSEAPGRPDAPGYAAPPVPPGYDAPPSRPASGDGPQLVLAGWGRRAGAWAIDGLIVGLLAAVFVIPLGVGLAAEGTTGEVATAGAFLLTALVYVVAVLVYAPLMMTRTNGQTVGRMATGIRVVRANGRPMDFGCAMLREVVVKKLLFFLVGWSVTVGLAWLLDYLWPLWDEENRALHDFLAQTRVVLA